MPDKTAPAEVASADAVTTPALTQDGVTPPPNAVATADSMSDDQAREILRGAGRKPVREVDVLSDEGDGRDPLLDEGTTLEEVLGYEPETATDPVPKEEETAETTETAEAEPEASTAEQATEEPPVKTEADGRKRVNIFRKNADGTFVHSDLTRRAMIMADEHGIDLIDALKTLGAGDKLSEKPAEAVPAKKEPTAAEIDAQIADLKARRKEAKANFNDDAKDDLTEQIEELLQSRQDALHRDAQAQQAQRETQSTMAEKVNASMAEAIRAYPDSGTEGTPLNVAAQAETDRLHAIQSPLLQDEDWPETVLAKVAARMGIAPVAKTAPVAKPATAPVVKAPAPKVAPLKRATPVPAPGSVSAPVAKVDPRKELERQIDATRDPAELQKLMRQAVQLANAA